MAEAAAGASFWSTKEEALAFLNPLLELTTPSKDACILLAAAPIAAYMKGHQPDPQVAALFLQATAKHLTVLATSEVGDDNSRLNQIRGIIEVRLSLLPSCCARHDTQYSYYTRLLLLHSRSTHTNTVFADRRERCHPLYIVKLQPMHHFSVRHSPCPQPSHDHASQYHHCCSCRISVMCVIGGTISLCTSHDQRRMANTSPGINGRASPTLLLPPRDDSYWL